MALARSPVWHALTCAGLLAACGHSSHTLSARKALDNHDPATALTLYNKQLKVESGAQQPADVSGDVPLYLLDRSVISQAVEHYQDSSQDLERADKSVEMLDFSRSTVHEVGRYLFSDNTGPYKARPYEKLLINTLNMLNYLARSDLQGAKIEARRLAVMQKYLKESQDDPGAALLGPGSYLAGFVFEMAREFDEALRYYDEALNYAPYTTLDAPVRRTAQFSGYSSPRLKEVMSRSTAAPAAADDTSGEVLVLIGYGRVPALNAVRLPIGLALTLAGMHLDPEQNVAARRLAGQGLVTWVNYPALEAGAINYALPSVVLDQTPLPLDVVTDVDALVRAALEREKGKIIASAIVRLIVRGAVGAGTGVGVARATNNSGLGMLAALVTQAAMVAADIPDTRSWATLPARIAIARVRVPAGRHSVRLSAQGVVRERSVEVSPGGFAVLNLTELSRY
jgi:tetratricopeptide (TPR) repeat protein